MFAEHLGGEQAPDASWHWLLLQRHGMRPLGFFGRLLLQRSAASPGGLAMRLRLFEAAQAGFAAAIKITGPSLDGPAPAAAPGQAVPCWRHAVAAPDPAGLARRLHGFQPCGILLQPPGMMALSPVIWRQVLAGVTPG